MTTYTIYCPECGSESVEITQKKSIERERVSIDELPINSGATFQPAIRKIYHYIAVCQDCGYHREYDDSGAATIGTGTGITFDADGSIAGCGSPNVKLTSDVPLSGGVYQGHTMKQEPEG